MILTFLVLYLLFEIPNITEIHPQHLEYADQDRPRHQQTLVIHWQITELWKWRKKQR